MKISPFIYLAILIIAFLFLFQIKIPLCYQSPEKRPIRYVIYDEEIATKIKTDIQEKPYYSVRINGESMEPSIKHDDVCACYAQPDYNVNDIISFYVPAPDNKIELIAHRIIIEDEGKFRSKGDANPFADSQMIEKEQIFCKIPETSLFEKFKFAIVEYGEFRIR